MRTYRNITAFCLILFFYAGIAIANAASAEGSVEIMAKLEVFANSYLLSCNQHIRPSKTNPAIDTRNGKIVLTYIEYDTSSMEAELVPSTNSAFSYLARMQYIEHTYEAVGDTEEAARAASYVRIRTRRLTELPRYSASNGWQN